ncbi:MAG: hypothetical protein AAGE01_01705 [Pseudomonadota bacterium]
MTFSCLRNAAIGAALLFATPFDAVGNDAVEEALERFVADYASDPMALDITFGIDVDGDRWHVRSAQTGDAPRTVSLEAGFPDTPMIYFKTTADVLGRIDAGELSGLTAMAAETSDQLTPLDVFPVNGYERGDDYDAMLRPLIFHFWTRGLPETVPLGMANTRVVHGAPGTVMYYDANFRSAVYHVPPRLGRDMAPTITVPFPRVLVVLAGEMSGTVGPNPFSIPRGTMVFVPPNVPATLWNDQDEPLELMFLMFGDGA